MIKYILRNSTSLQIMYHSNSFCFEVTPQSNFSLLSYFELKLFFR